MRKLRDDQVIEIYNDNARSIPQLAKRYPVSKSLITSIRKKERHAKLLEGLPEPDRFDHREVAKDRKLTDAQVLQMDRNPDGWSATKVGHRGADFFM